LVVAASFSAAAVDPAGSRTGNNAGCYASTQRVLTTGLTSGVNAQGVSVQQTSSSSSFQAPALITDKSQQRWHRAHHMLLELASKAGSLPSACFAQDTWQLETPD